MKEISVAKAMRSGMVWNLLSVVATQGAGFVIFLILAARLSPEIFGVVAISAVLADIYANEGRNAGMDAVLQARAYDRRSLNAAFWGLMAIAVLLAVGLTAGASFVARIQEEPLIALFMPVFAVTLLFVPWLCVMDALIMKEMGFRTFAQRNILSTLVGGAAGIACAFSPYDIWALAVQRVASVGVIFLFELLHTRWVPAFGLDRKHVPNILGRFLPLWAVSSLAMLTSRMTVFIFGLRYDGTTVGLFRAADRINESVYSPLVSPLFALWFPMMTKVRGEIEKEREIYEGIIRTAAFLTLPALAGLIVVADDIVALLLPETYAGVANLMQAVSAAALLIPFAWFNGIAMNALNMNRVALLFSIVSTAAAIGTLLLAGGASAPVAVLLMAAPGLVLGPLGGVILHRRLGISNRRHFLGLVPAVVATALMAAAVWAAHNLLIASQVPGLTRLAICVPLGGVLYFGWLFLFHRQWLRERIALLRGRN